MTRRQKAIAFFVALCVLLVIAALGLNIGWVIANAGRENAPSLPSTFVRAPMRPMITPPAESVAEDAAADAAGHRRSEPRERA